MPSVIRSDVILNRDDSLELIIFEMGTEKIRISEFIESAEVRTMALSAQRIHAHKAPNIHPGNASEESSSDRVLKTCLEVRIG